MIRLEIQSEKEGVLETKEDLRSLETEEEKKESEAKNGIKDIEVEKSEEEVDGKVENEEVKEEKEKKEKEEQRDEVITKGGKVDQSLISVPDKINISAMGEATNADSTNVIIEIEKEPVRIVDYHQKKDRAHEPKIVEEMSVKKEENLNKVSHPGDINLKNKKEDFEKIISIDKQEQEVMNEEWPTKIPITSEEFNKTTPESETVSPEVSKTEEDNDISSEQLKTNSLSDMSLSENLNSEGEEAAREAAKALELKEMVESLSATANRLTLDYEISDNSNNPKDVSKDDITVIPGSHIPEEPEPAKPESSTANNVPEEKLEENFHKSFETPQLFSEHSSEKEPSNVSIPETSEETISSSENSQGENESSRLKGDDDLVDSAEKLTVKITDCNIQEKENDETEMELQNVRDDKYDVVTEDKITIQRTALQHEEREIEQTGIDIRQSVLGSKEIVEKAAEGEVNQFEQKEAKLKNDEETVLETVKLEQNKNNDEVETDLRKWHNEKDHELTDHRVDEEKKIDKENKPGVKFEVKDNPEATAATIIQSGFRGYQVRKQLKESGAEEEVKQILGEEGKIVFEEENKLLNGAIYVVPENVDDEIQIAERENDLLAMNESKISETEEEEVTHVPESLMKIAQAEVDKICKEAEKATESLMTPPLVKDNSETEIQEEEFPAPPDELLTSESQNEEIKEDQSSSGTQSTEPTMPLGSNNTEGDSSKTEDTTAPSLADSEIPKSTGQSRSLQNDDFRLESSITENINTEIAMQRDPTEGELTMEEDSTREDDFLVPIRSDVVSKTDGESSLTPVEEKAATVIQAGYRGFRTRKRLREESSTRSDTGTVEQVYIKNESSDMKSSIKDEGKSNSSNSLSDDKSEKELIDSAKKIQAGVRGYLVRKKQKVERDAAVTIQSHFRGFKTRQRLKQKST